MERHANKTNVTETIKVPLQYSKTDKTIFAYLRRSTKKEEQRESKQKQNDSIDLMAKDLGINIEDIQIFEDDFTGFKINTKNGKPQTKRKGYIALMEAIDKCKVPCILLAYDCSRLARNVPDGITICEKLGLYGNKQKIEYIRFYDGTKWDKTTRDKTINDAFSEANGYSEALSKQKQDKNITSLRRGIMPKTIKAPHGLQCTGRGFEETDTMPYIYRAFEMKVEGTLGKDISKYLISHGIPVSEGNLAFMIFQKTQYIGEYTHSKTGDVFENLKFVSGRTAIPRHLWDKVQARIGKKVGGYGEKQQGDIIAGLLRWEEDKTKSFSLDIKTKPNGKQHKYYKSNSFGGVNIGEKKIIKEFIKELERIINYISEKRELGGIKFMEVELEELEKDKEDILKSITESFESKEHIESDNEARQLLKEVEEALEELGKEEGEEAEKDRKKLQEIKKKIEEELEQSTEKYFLEKMEAETNNEGEEIEELKKRGEIEKAERIRNKELSVYRIGKKIKSIKDSNISYIREKEINADTKKQLENKKQELEIEKKTILKNAIKGGFRVEDANELIGDTEKEIRAIENQIEDLSKSTDMEQFINRLPEVLNETFELASKMLSSADIETMRDDIEQLLEICTFELTINEKKELKIKLFDGLECGKISVVGDIGFEPMTLCV